MTSTGRLRPSWSAVSRLPFRVGSQGEARPLATASALAGGKSGPAIVPGKLDESLLWERVESDEMPPKSPLAETEKAVLRDWIAAGAPGAPIRSIRIQVTTTRRAGRDWWSLQPVRRPAGPPCAAATGCERRSMRFVLQKLEANGLRPAPEADKQAAHPPTQLRPDRPAADARGGRRVSRTITSPDAYERLVDRYLASPQYGVRWARWWLDLARYGESNGFEFDEFRPTAWRYRDWVVDSLNRDRPYDEFARLQLAGDVLRPDDPAAIEATGFLVAGAYDTAGQNQQ